MKEISSDGDVSTIDVVYPAAPFFIDQAPETLRRMLVPVLAYGNNETAPYGLDMQYNLSWAPHHLGTWPVCDLAPMDQEQMPVEESGNLLIMLAAIAKKQGWDADSVAYLTPYLPILNGYADYIIQSLPDPGDQLCTDDFEGPSPHNSNLAAKGIVALEAWAQVLGLIDGQSDAAALYSSKATEFYGDWLELAIDGSGDHYKMECVGSHITYSHYSNTHDTHRTPPHAPQHATSVPRTVLRINPLRSSQTRNVQTRYNHTSSIAHYAPPGTTLTTPSASSTTYCSSTCWSLAGRSKTR